MSDYLDIILSRVKEPGEAIRPNLPSIFEPLPLSIRFPGGVAPEDAEGIDKGDPGLRGTEAIDEYDAEPEDAGDRHDEKSKATEEIGMQEAVGEITAPRGREDTVYADNKVKPSELRPRSPAGEGDRIGRHAFYLEETDWRAKAGAVWENPREEQAAELMMRSFLKPLSGPLTGDHMAGGSPDPPPGSPRINDRGNVTRRGRADSMVDEISEDLLKDEDHLRWSSPGRFRPVEDSVLKPAERLKEMALPKAGDPKQTGEFSDSRPTIKVTIGRVEVRAVTRPSQAKKDRPEKPRQSLEDYLRQRRGGTR